MKITFDPSDLDDCLIVQDIMTLVSRMPVAVVPAPPVAVVPAPPVAVVPAPPVAVVPVQTAVPCDIGGVPWNSQFHTDSKNKTNKGFWKRKKGASLEEYDAFAKSFTTKTAPPMVAPPHVLIVEDEDRLADIDNLFADIQDKNVVGDFGKWSLQMLSWCKPGATTILDLTGDIPAQEQLFDHLKSL